MPKTTPAPDNIEGRARAVIESLTPQIDAGRYPIKRVLGETVSVEADCFADGHDSVSALLKFRFEKSREWSETPMEPLVNDRWMGEFPIEQLGNYYYTVEAWVDHFKTWRKDLRKKVEAEQDVSLDLLAGAELIEGAARRAPKSEARILADWARAITARNDA